MAANKIYFSYNLLNILITANRLVKMVTPMDHETTKSTLIYVDVILIYYFVSRFYDHKNTIDIIKLLLDGLKHNNEEVNDLELYDKSDDEDDLDKDTDTNEENELEMEEISIFKAIDLNLEETIYYHSKNFSEYIFCNSSVQTMDWVKRINSDGINYNPRQRWIDHLLEKLVKAFIFKFNKDCSHFKLFSIF